MKPIELRVADRLRSVSLRPTKQRMMLGQLLWSAGNRHVTAEQLHSESRHAHMQVSMATVYNTLHQFVEAGLLAEVVVDGNRSYFDTNIEPHYHFLYEKTGELEDIPAAHIAIANLPRPAGDAYQISRVDVIIRVR